jgi:hypothetical protein
MRRSGVVEASLDCSVCLLKLANSIERSNTLPKTYAPVDVEAVRPCSTLMPLDLDSAARCAPGTKLEQKSQNCSQGESQMPSAQTDKYLMMLATPAGAPEPKQIQALECQTSPKTRIEPKGLFPAVANHAGGA